MEPAYPDSPMEQDESYPCKGCGEILEEGKAFELAGYRWHIDCFRCNTCQTLLDSDANLLLLGDGSLICNNCTYSCSACGNKIEDLAILTGDQAYCAACFRCRNCKKRIENLRYARTSQGMFCMDCHDALMARRRKKTGRTAHRKQNNAQLDKSLPSLPPNALPTSNFSPDRETPPSTFSNSDTPTELPGSVPPSRMNSSLSAHRDPSPANSDHGLQGNLTLPASSYRHGRDLRSGGSYGTVSDDFIPMALDPNVAEGPSPMLEQKTPQANGKTSGSAKADPELPGTDYFNIKEKSAKRKIPREPRVDDPASLREIPQPASPHIALQSEGVDSETIDAIRRRKASNPGPANHELPGRETHQYNHSQSDQDRFKLQEAPKRRKSSSHRYSGNGFDSREGFPSLHSDAAATDSKMKPSPASAHAVLREQHINIAQTDSARTSQMDTPTQASPRVSQDSRFGENGPISGFDVNVLPKRGDSLQKPVPSASSISRKDVPSSKTTPYDTHLETSPLPPSSARSLDTSFNMVNMNNMNGGRVISGPMESPISKSAFDVPYAGVDQGDDPLTASSDSFASPRAAPPRPVPDTTKHKAKNSSVSTVRSESFKSGDQPASPSLGRFPTIHDVEGRGFGEESTTANFLRKFSKSGRHNRSQSDRGSRNSREQKWPKTPLNGHSGILADRELSSPTISSPESKGEQVLSSEIGRLRNENDLMHQKIIDLESRLQEAQNVFDGKDTMTKIKSELREKRSTIVELDVQKSIVIRELELITDSLQAAKESGKSFDLNKMQSQVLHEFYQSLEDLKEAYTPQIEERLQRKIDLDDELARLNELKEEELKIFKTLCEKNAWLINNNNEIAQESNNKTHDSVQSNNHGLGIYNHHKEKSSYSVDSREIASLTDSQLTGRGGEHPPDSATIMSTPQVVNIQKIGPKKRTLFGKGGTVAKGVTRGFKDAFSSQNNAKLARDFGVVTEGVPYGSTSTGAEPRMTTLHHQPLDTDAKPQGFGFFNQQKPKTVLTKAPAHSPLPSKSLNDPSIIFGTELEQRAAFEGASVPYIVTRCIDEVETRGMKSEGIYRKSGSKTQIDAVKEMFQYGDDSKISDPDFDINAVASTLKQYFRNLPNPLLTHKVYDKLIDFAMVNDEDRRVPPLRKIFNELPVHHKVTLEYLIFHLSRVVRHNNDNLMTSVNLGVVFAPTLMICEDPQKDLQYTQQKNWLIGFMIDHCQEIFYAGKGENGSI